MQAWAGVLVSRPRRGRNRACARPHGDGADPGAADPWLARMLARKPNTRLWSAWMLVAVALANRMARIAWETVKVSELYGLWSVARLS